MDSADVEGSESLREESEARPTTYLTSVEIIASLHAS